MRFSDNGADGTITVASETQTNDPDTGELVVESSGEITWPYEQWLQAVVSVLEMLPGKLNEDATGYALAPYPADPDMVGTLVAEMLKARRRF